MKKFFAFTAAASLMLGVASCSSDIDAPEAVGDGNVNLTVALPDAPGTRAFSDGKTAKALKVAVYDVTGDTPALVETKDYTFAGESLSTTVSLDLATGRNYKIALFANQESNSPYTFSADAKKITVDYTKMTDYNTADYDCFYRLYETGVVNGPINEEIKLYRPVAQVNWGTSDLEKVALRYVYGTDANDANLTNLYTKVTTKAYTEFSLLDSDVTGDEVEVTFPLANRPAASETYPYQPKVAEGETAKVNYKYLSMQYLLVPQASSLVDITLESAASNDAAAKTVATVKVPNAPVQANYRTNIFGALLTNPAVFTVVKEKGWAGADYNWSTEPVEVKSNEELVVAIQNGGNYIIPEGQSLTMPDVTKTVAITRPLKLQVEGTMSLTGVGDATSGDNMDHIANLKLLKVSSDVEITGGGTIEGNGGDCLFACRGNGKLSIDGVNIVYNCTPSAANRTAISTGVNPVTIKNSTITSNCTAVYHNDSGRLIMENVDINVSLYSADYTYFNAIFSRGDVDLTNVKIDSKARGLEIEVSYGEPFEAVIKDCEFYAEGDRVLHVDSWTTKGSKLTIDGGKYSCKNTTVSKYKSPIIFDNNQGGRSETFDCNIISGEFVTLPWGFTYIDENYDWKDHDPSIYLAPGSEWEEITPAATNPVYTWRVVKKQ